MLTPLGFSQEIVTSGSALALEIAPTQAMVSIAAVDKGNRILDPSVARHHNYQTALKPMASATGLAAWRYSRQSFAPRLCCAAPNPLILSVGAKQRVNE